MNLGQGQEFSLIESFVSSMKLSKLAPSFKQVDPEFSRTKQLRRCQSCRWPRARAHLDILDSIQQTQSKYLENHLMKDPNTNARAIQELTFHHGLWPQFIKSLDLTTQLVDYVDCCLALDDIELLEPSMFDDVALLERMIEAIRRNETGLESCPRCRAQLEDIEPYRDEMLPIMGEFRPRPDERSFTTSNLLVQILEKRPNSLHKSLDMVLKYNDLLEGSKVPKSFYLKALYNMRLPVTRSS